MTAFSSTDRLHWPELPPERGKRRAARVVVDGKQFARDGQRFAFRGVTYGTFEPRLDGALFPPGDVVKKDFSLMAERGFTVVRTYTAPPEDVLELAAEWGLQVLAGVFYPDWRYLSGVSRADLRDLARTARSAVREAAERLAGHGAVLAVCLGNEVPADAIRWVGSARVERVLGELVGVVRDVDPDVLVTYASYPTAEYLTVPDLDFLTYNVFLERPEDLRRYVNRLHNLAGDRPLVLGELGWNVAGSDGEQRQAEAIDWQLEVALERGVAGSCVFSWTDDWWVGGHRVEGWRFGLTTGDRCPRPALDVVERWNQRTVGDLAYPWPRISVVVCAYNAEATIDECLAHTCALDYPDLEIVVVDDGSTDATAAIAERHPRARLVPIAHAGLSVARNAGFRAATGDLIAYLDSDAYPTPEWPYFLALGMNSREVAAVGGPNVPPRDDPPGAQVVARAPGGPVHVLVGDDRAEHVPGCNMAFWRYALTEIGGFDPVYAAAGDDVDVCWKVLDRGYEIGFHPAALVWHHRRVGLRTYLRQQRGYGRAEALVQVRHPDRFTPLGTARWGGRIYNSLVPTRGRQRIYRGEFGTAPFQSIYRAGGYAIDVAHQVGVPAATAALATGPAGVASWPLALPALLGAIFLLGLLVVDAVRARPPRGWSGSRVRFRTSVALHHLLQPLVRLCGRWWRTGSGRRDLAPPAAELGPATHLPGGVTLLPSTGERLEVTGAIVRDLRRAGLRVVPSTGWEPYDARIAGSVFVDGTLLTSAFPHGCTQVRVRPAWRTGRLLGAAVVAVAAGSVAWVAGAVLGAAVTAETARGWWRVRQAPRRVLAPDPGTLA